MAAFVSRKSNLERAPTGFRELAQLFLDVEPCCRANGDTLITSSGSPGILRGCARPLFARGELFAVGDAGGCVQAVGRSSHGSMWWRGDVEALRPLWPRRLRLVYVPTPSSGRAIRSLREGSTSVGGVGADL